jgi:hypothetical protein
MGTSAVPHAINARANLVMTIPPSGRHLRRSFQEVSSLPSMVNVDAARDSVWGR